MADRNIKSGPSDQEDQCKEGLRAELSETVLMMRAAETGFRDWAHEEEDIYGPIGTEHLSPLIDANSEEDQ